MRRLFALIVVLSVSGFLPLAANAGYCVTPCCRAHASGDLSIASPSCCDETNCAPASRDAQATTDLVKSLARPSSEAVAHFELPSACVLTPSADLAVAASPPAQQRRLAALSTLLI
jgi:hypothetical protein